VPVTAIIAALLCLLVILDMIVERGRKDDLLQPSNRRLTFWLKRHLMRFSFFMLGHMALIYFFVRLPYGTYEDELVTKVYDGMLIVLMILAMLEGAAKKLWGIPTQYISFFWGMLTTTVALILLFWQPETRFLLVITLAATVAGIVALIQNRLATAAEA
jgi:hypothetical protein